MVLAAGFGIWRLREANEQKDAVAEINRLLGEKIKVGEKEDFKIGDPVCRAKAMQTVGMYLLFSKEGKAGLAKDIFSGAQSVVVRDEADEVKATVNEQLFLGDLAHSQFEMGGSPDKQIREDEVIRKLKLNWDVVQGAPSSRLCFRSRTRNVR